MFYIVEKKARGIVRIVFGFCNVFDGLVNILSLGYLQSKVSLNYAKHCAKQRIQEGFCK